VAEIRQRGQASVETVALLPALLALAAASWQALLIAWALTCAAHAAGAGAHAELAGGEVRPAVERALPAAMRAGVGLDESAHAVRVTVLVPSVIPGFSPHVSASAAVAAR
jgi:hypothetical protein